MNLTRAVLAVLCAPLLLAIAAPAVADDPARQHPHVNDLAGLLDDGETAELRALLDAFAADTGIELVVATVPSYRAYGETAIDRFAARLFADWGLGERGVLLIVGRDEREAIFEVGPSFGHAYDRRLRYVLDGTVFPHFHAERLGHAVLMGARAATVELGNGWQPATAAAAPPG